MDAAQHEHLSLLPSFLLVGYDDDIESLFLFVCWEAQVNLLRQIGVFGHEVVHRLFGARLEKRVRCNAKAVSDMAYCAMAYQSQHAPQSDSTGAPEILRIHYPS